MNELLNYSPDFIVKPGETILEMLDEHAMTQKELAKRMGLTEKTVCEIIKGNSPITQKHAKSLENILELPYSFWINLQRNYDDALFNLHRTNELNSQIELAEKFPLETLKMMGLIPKGRNKGIDLVEKLLRVFKVQNLNQILGLYNLEFDCKISEKHAVDEYALVTWMRLGELQAEKHFDYDYLPTFDSKKTHLHLSKLRNLNLEVDPSIFLNQLEKECEELGIIFVVVPEIKRSRISGMARWLKVGKRKIPMIQLSLRGKKHDMFWFTFFHELGHILLHRNELCIDIDNKGSTDDKESEADSFARDILIPESLYQNFLQFSASETISITSIKSFANDIGVHPGILLGRLQKEGFTNWNRFNELKTTYKWDFEKI